MLASANEEEAFGKLSYRLVMTVAFMNLPHVELPAYSLHKTNTLKSW